MKTKSRIKREIRRLLFLIKKKIKNDTNIYLIYTMGKVGSSSIYHSLKKQKPYSEIYHVHFLSKNYLDNILPKEHKIFHSSIPKGRDILSAINQRPKSRIKIITLTREPVGRSISELLQNWKHIYDDIESVPHDELKKHIESKPYNYTLEWFDKEFKEYLNFDIYQHKFDKEKGYETYKHGRFDILCIKLEKLNSVYEKAFLDFLGEKLNLFISNT